MLEKKKAANKKEVRNDPFRFQVGVNFKAKIIGIDDVPEARGDRMCQEAIQRQKLAVKAKGGHKQRIIVNVSLEGVKIIDELSMNAIHTHAVHRVSFISRDVSDARAFGYIYGPGDGTHKFFGIKTEKAAENLVLTLRDLFQVVFEMKKKESLEKKQQDETKDEVKSETLDKKQEVTPEEKENVIQTTVIEPEQPKEETVDLFGLNDLNNLQQTINDIDSFDPMDNKPENAGFGGTPEHKNPPLALEDDDPFVTSPIPGLNSTTSSTGANWAAFSSPTSTQPTNSMFNQPAPSASTPAGFNNPPFSPTSSTGSDMFGQSAFGGPTQGFGAAPNSSPFGAPAPAAPAQSAPFGAPAAPAQSAPFGAPAAQAAPFGAPTGGPFGAPGAGPFGAPSTGGFGASPFGAPAMGNPMGSSMQAPNGPSANPFLSSGGIGGGMGAPPSNMNSMSNGFGTLSPTPAPGSQKEVPKAKSADPLFDDLVGSFGADLGKKSKDEFFKPGPSPIVNDMLPKQPQVSDDKDAFESDPFDTGHTNESNNNSDINSPDFPAPKIPPPPLPQAQTAQEIAAPSLPPRPSNAMRQASSTSTSSGSSTNTAKSAPAFPNVDLSKLPDDPPPAPPPRPGSRSSHSYSSQFSNDSSKSSPILTRQTTMPCVIQQKPPALPLRKQTSMTSQMTSQQGSTPPPLPSTSPPHFTTQQGLSDTPPPPPPRPGLESKRAPKLVSTQRSMTVPEEPMEAPVPRPRPRANTPSEKSKDLEFSLSSSPGAVKGSDPFAVTLPKPKSRNVDSTFARPRPRPRSKTPTASLTTAEFSLKTESLTSQNNKTKQETDISQNNGNQSQNAATTNFEFQFDTKPTDSPVGSYKVGSTRDGYSSDHRTATPVSIHSGHSISSGDQVLDPFANVDPFEKDGGDPFATKDPFEDKDPFSENDPFSGVDPFGNTEDEFQTKAVSAEGVPLRPDSCNSERRKKLMIDTDIFANDPFSLSGIDPLPGKKLTTPLIGDGNKRDSHKSDPFDTAFAAATLSTTSFSPQFQTNTAQNSSSDIFANQFVADFNMSESPARNAKSETNVDQPLSSASFQSPFNDQHDFNHNHDHSIQHESDSTSYNSEVSEAFATTPRSSAQRSSTPGYGNGSSVANGRGTPGNPFLSQVPVPIPPQAPQPPPPGATLLDF